MISEKDYEQLQASGRSNELVQRQYEFLINGSSLLKEIRPARLGDGINKLSKNEEEEALQSFQTQADIKRWMKFVPASGAASRMFAPLHALQQAINQKNFDLNAYQKTPQGKEISKLIENVKRLPFFGSIHAKILEDKKITVENQEAYFLAFVQKVLSQFVSYPKALIPFFVDDQGKDWTSFEAQLQEAINLGHKNSPVPLHLTIDKAHKDLFDEVVQRFQQKKEGKEKQTFYIEYSHQHRLTDTPFIDGNKKWARDEDGAIAFRKGGHGSLLENLNHLDADCVWIKNVDNILLGKVNAEGEKWMKILAGKLLHLQEELFKHLKSLEKLKDKTKLEPIVAFIQSNFNPRFNLNSEAKMSHEVLFDYLYRPLRICGMIPAFGAVGGGPFWKKVMRGESLQIVEGVELDPTDAAHAKAIAGSTHFNPVMMVCGITDHLGEKFSLYDFRDDKRFMISKKMQENMEINILEWPGLWNGGMAEWNTIFIELPPQTFNPVKTVMDLIR